MAPSTRRWLLASAVLNLFLICAIAGGAWQWWKVQRTGTQPASAVETTSRGLRHAADGLAAEQRQAYLVALRDARRDVTGQLQASRDGRQELLRLLSAAQFDRDAAASALARVREADTASRTRFEAVVVDFAATLPASDRQRFAAALARRGAASQAGEPPGTQSTK